MQSIPNEVFEPELTSNDIKKWVQESGFCAFSFWHDNPDCLTLVVARKVMQLCNDIVLGYYECLSGNKMPSELLDKEYVEVAFSGNLICGRQDLFERFITTEVVRMLKENSFPVDQFRQLCSDEYELPQIVKDSFKVSCERVYD